MCNDENRFPKLLLAKVNKTSNYNKRVYSFFVKFDYPILQIHLGHHVPLDRPRWDHTPKSVYNLCGTPGAIQQLLKVKAKYSWKDGTL